MAHRAQWPASGGSSGGRWQPARGKGPKGGTQPASGGVPLAPDDRWSALQVEPWESRILAMSAELGPRARSKRDERRLEASLTALLARPEDHTLQVALACQNTETRKAIQRRVNAKARARYLQDLQASSAKDTKEARVQTCVVA